jgi:general transcriptional corepressor TUP1
MEVYTLAFSPDGRYLVSGSGDKSARVWDLESKSSLHNLVIEDTPGRQTQVNGEEAGVTNVAISPNGRWIAAGSLDNVVRVWNASTGRLIEKLRGHKDSVYSVAFAPDGNSLFSGSLDKNIKMWDLTSLNRLGDDALEGDSKSGVLKTFQGHKVRSSYSRESNFFDDFLGWVGLRDLGWSLARCEMDDFRVER